jgi:trehalose 6-phosphate synthase/phosphatase
MNKGLAAVKLLSSDSFDFVLAMGDDVTDEDMFEALDDQSHITIKVGLDKSKARYNLIGINNVISFLDQLAFLN